MTIKPMRTMTAMAARKSLSSIATNYKDRGRSFLSGNRDQTPGAADTLLKDARRPPPVALRERNRAGQKAAALNHQGHHQQRDDVDDLDERVDRGAGGVFVRIADRVAGDRGLVRIGA